MSEFVRPPFGYATKEEAIIADLNAYQKERELLKAERDELQRKLDITVNLLERLRHWDMLWLGIGQPSLVADGLYWKREIDETLKKLEK